jgi:diaminohydroxyphosphoribosylaminopyrimidine deaminase / 5-amino-6-(5-phosphoribosylamino)uracil reductase
MDNPHNLYMKRAMELAQKGLGLVSPNPLVGCVLVKDGVIVSEGYHQKFGGAHAEVNAILNLPSNINPKDCTLYVNLEPCCHHGKTPPCTDLIISRGIKKVVVSNSDPNPLVAGIGIEKLREAGVEVITGVCEKEGRYLNRRFFTFHEKRRPYIILKWAQTSDGFISRWPLPENRNENKISGDEAQKLVHHMRSTEDAILVGKNTVLNDDPFLTTRLVEGKNPIRVIITGNDIPYTFNIFNSDAKIVVFNPHRNEVKDHITYIRLNSGNAIPQILGSLYKMGISSVLIEGGSYTLSCFISAGLWDEQHVFVDPELNFGEGIKAPKINLNIDFQCVGKDRYHVIRNPESSK